MPRMIPGRPRRMMHQSNPGVRRLRLSQPSIHLPRSVYLPSIKTGVPAFSRFSLGAKKSSLATSTAPPTRSDAKSISSVKSIKSLCVPLRPLRLCGYSGIYHRGAEHAEVRRDELNQHLAQRVSGKLAPIINLSSAKKSLLHDALQRLTRVRRDLVSMKQGRGIDSELLIGIPDHKIGIPAHRDRSLPRLQRDLFRGIRTKPLRHIQQ